MAAYEKLAAVYDRFMEDVDYQRWAQGLAAWIGARTQVADLACGTGNLTLPLARMGYGAVSYTHLVKKEADHPRFQGIDGQELNS